MWAEYGIVGRRMGLEWSACGSPNQAIEGVLEVDWVGERRKNSSRPIGAFVECRRVAGVKTGHLRGKWMEGVDVGGWKG